MRDSTADMSPPFYPGPTHPPPFFVPAVFLPSPPSLPSSLPLLPFHPPSAPPLPPPLPSPRFPSLSFRCLASLAGSGGDVLVPKLIRAPPGSKHTGACWLLSRMLIAGGEPSLPWRKPKGWCNLPEPGTAPIASRWEGYWGPQGSRLWQARGRAGGTASHSWLRQTASTRAGSDLGTAPYSCSTASKELRGCSQACRA